MSNIAAGAVVGEFFEGALTAFTAGAVVTFAHGLRGAPHMVQIVLECTTAEHGHSIGDQLVMNPAANDFDEASGPARHSNMITFDATNVYIFFPPVDAGNSPAIPDRSTPGFLAIMTIANWSYRVRAVRFSF